MTNIETIQAYYNAFNKDDFNKMLSYVAEDVLHEGNEIKAEQGLANMKRFMQEMDEHYQEQVVDLELFSGTTSDRVSAEFFIEGIYKKTATGLPEASGQKYRLRVGAFFELSEGKIKRVTNYYNLRNWIQLVS